MSKLHAFITYLQRRNANRDQMKKIQSQMLRKLINHAFHFSSFYRELYLSHGIKEKDLNEVNPHDLPVTNKQLLMEHLDDVFTDKTLKKSEIETWLYTHREPEMLYKKKYYICHTSGSSAKLGIFVFDKPAWDYFSTLSGMRVLMENKFILRPRILFFGATHGHFSGVSIIAHAPTLMYQPKFVSVLEPVEKSLQEINQFQPQIITGYPSAISMLIDAAKHNKLHINPSIVITSGEVLTINMAEEIQSIWHKTPMDIFSTTETLSVGYRKSVLDEFVIFDDLAMFEVLDKNNARVKQGEVGESVVTNLYNFAMPIIRYKMNDSIIASKNTDSTSPYTRFHSILGRVMEPLPIINDRGVKDFINPHVINEFFVPHIQGFQFEMEPPNKITIFYVANQNLESEIREEFNKILSVKQALNGTIVKVEKVPFITQDSSGKVKLIKLK